jgi:plasmid segregation protein ParM
MRAVGIDVGYGFTKFSVVHTKKGPVFDSVPSVASPVRGQEFRSAGPDSLGAMIDVDGTAYYVGQDVAAFADTMVPSNTSSGFVLSAPYKALYRGALYQIAKRQQSLGNEMRIEHATVGLPLTTFLDFEGEVQAFSKGVHLVPHPHKGATLKVVVVEEASVMLQPLGVLLSTADENFKDEVMAVVDVGTGTTDVLVVVEGTPNFTRSGSFDLGLNRMLEAAVDTIERSLVDSPVFMGRMHRALRNAEPHVKHAGRLYPMGGLMRAMEPVADKIMDRVASISGLPGDIGHIVLAGGGAEIFMKALMRKYPNLHERVAIAEDPVFSAVRGFHLAAERTLEEAQSTI